ncbi:MAG: GMC family oxidoreductase [Gemmatimonadaceae bacterium]|nr:GMC family oxidoreductase [Gemmatimonadaceae bacterium]
MSDTGRQPRTPRYRPTDVVDFVVVGSGSAGGIVARELSRAGLRVVVLEQGPYRRASDFLPHDDYAVFIRNALTNDAAQQGTTFRTSESDVAKPGNPVWYARGVGGGSVHFTGNFWRLRPEDFREHTLHGDVPGAALADWPISYDELEPYYTRVDWEIGVSGQAGADPHEPRRSKPYPMPPLPVKPEGLLMEKAARKMGWTAFPAPMAIASQPFRGRGPCQACGYCLGFGCEFGAKSSTLVAMIPDAERTGRCEVRSECYVRKVETDARGRVTGVIYFDRDRREVLQRARAVVLCANGAETPRLLLNSASARFPQGLANSSGLVGRHLMYNGNVVAGGVFEHETNGYKGPVVTRIVQDPYVLDPSLGLVGGGGFDFRFDSPPLLYAIRGQGEKAPQWGAAFKRALRDFPRTVYAYGHTTSLPVPANSISLDPTHKDAWGVPAMRVTYREHPNDMKVYRWFLDRCGDLLDAAGALRRWEDPIREAPEGSPHLLGTCRMGNDPSRSVVDRHHRAHDVPNLFIVDGSSMVTGGRGQPTMTIMALAFRASEQMVRWARRAG